MTPIEQGIFNRRKGGKLAENPHPESALEDSPYARWRQGWMSLGTSFRLPAGRERANAAPGG